mmetsp:Transcript_10499/g.10493  ORF Transcript_10499/g.10493 Transcript_10499/m.10493 type:complete len:116 (-) Transcript_10499:190-537(-)
MTSDKYFFSILEELINRNKGLEVTIASVNISGKCLRLKGGGWVVFSDLIIETNDLALDDSSPRILAGTPWFQTFQTYDLMLEDRNFAFSLIADFQDLFGEGELSGASLETGLCFG